LYAAPPALAEADVAFAPVADSVVRKVDWSFEPVVVVLDVVVVLAVVVVSPHWPAYSQTYELAKLLALLATLFP
jgi:hypothetical protein